MRNAGQKTRIADCELRFALNDTWSRRTSIFDFRLLLSVSPTPRSSLRIPHFLPRVPHFLFTLLGTHSGQTAFRESRSRISRGIWAQVAAKTRLPLVRWS